VLASRGGGSVVVRLLDLLQILCEQVIGPSPSCMVSASIFITIDLLPQQYSIVYKDQISLIDVGIVINFG